MKYSNLKNGYVQTSISDNEWYSISGKRYPIAVYANPNDFDLNGVIKLSDCNQIYVWVPRFGKISGELYGFGYDTTDYIITYGDTLNKITEIITSIQWFFHGCSFILIVDKVLYKN